KVLGGKNVDDRAALAVGEMKLRNSLPPVCVHIVVAKKTIIGIGRRHGSNAFASEIIFYLIRSRINSLAIISISQFLDIDAERFFEKFPAHPRRQEQRRRGGRNSNPAPHLA